MFQGLFTQEAKLSLDIERDTFLEPGNTNENANHK